MKKNVLVVLAVVVLLSLSAAAQTSSGKLTVTAILDSSIQMSFVDDATGLALKSGTGTNAATLDFGNISAFGAINTGINRTLTPGTSFTVSTPIGINVVSANTSTTHHKLEAALESTTAFTYTVDSTTLTTNPLQVGNNLPNGTNAHTIAVTIPWGTAGSATPVTNIIDFVATAM